MTCPKGHPLFGLGNYCWGCEAYVEDLLAAPERKPAPRADSKPLADSRTEKQIQAAVAGVFQALGFRVWSLSQPRATMQSEGLGDLYVTGRGLCLWIETKRATGVQSDDQKEFEAAVVENGGLYRVVRHESEVPDLVNELCFG